MRLDLRRLPEAVPRRVRGQEAPGALPGQQRQVVLFVPHLRDRVRDAASSERSLRATLQRRVEGKAGRRNARLENFTFNYVNSLFCLNKCDSD